MSRWHTDTDDILRRYIIGRYHEDYEDGLHAIAAFSRADTTQHPEGVADA